MSTRRAITLFVVVMCCGLTAAPAARAVDTVLVGWGSTWKYRDNGSDLGSTWLGAGFDDSLWVSGPAPLGYGEPGVIVTEVGFGPDPQNKYVTTYFRQVLNVPDPSLYATAIVRLRRDDGGAVYVNGSEVLRSNLPYDAITAATFASSPVEHSVHEYAFPASLLVTGSNQLAVEVHQASPPSSDLVFDLELVANPDPFLPRVVRGPYLQLGRPDAMRVRWRTDFADDTWFAYGSSPSVLNTVFSSSTATTEHEVEVPGLAPDTLYYYAVGTSTGAIAGGDADHWFETSPAVGSRDPMRIWVLGDSGTANPLAALVRDAYVGYPGSAATDVWLMLGDNAYPSGSDGQYEAAVFDMYPAFLRTVPLWLTFGNHDAVSSTSSTQSGPYYASFTLPAGAEAGGLASGTEAYYSFDHGNVHFVCLDSQGTSRAANGGMAQWLAADLLATTQDWIVAFWHHPPYSKGGHDSDVEIELMEMRANLLPILEDGGVDLVLTGHSHSYERSVLLDGHYGTSATLQPGMLLDSGDGDPAGDGAYEKLTVGTAANLGAVYTVAGSSGQITGGLLNHPAMLVSLNVLGSLVIDVDGNQLDARFLDDVGVVRDHFALRKPVPGAPTCRNEVDDDHDGFVDHPADLGCSNPNGKEAPQCQDGLDNDGDGKRDFDGGVAAGQPPGAFPADPQCNAPWKDKEKPLCGLGFELALLLPLWARARRRRQSSASAMNR